MGLTERQRRFAEIYAANPNATEAAKAAGYSPKSAYSIGQENLKKPEICEYIRELQKSAEAGRVASMQTVKEYWSSVMLDPAERTSDRLKASELLAKAAGAFLHFHPDPDGGIIAASEVDGSDVLIYVPQMLTEEECQVEEGDMP